MTAEWGIMDLVRGSAAKILFLVVITAYLPDPIAWRVDFRTRAK